MRDLLTAQETARILGKRIDSLYNIVDAFDAKADDEWELVEGEHFELAGPAVAGAKRRRPRRFSEEGVEALARYIEVTEKTGVQGRFRERLFNVKQKRKQLLVSQRITQEFIEAGCTLELNKDLLQSEERQVGISQRGIARFARDMRVNSRITNSRQAWIDAVGEVVEACFKSEIRLAMVPDLHREFHSWKGGPCTPKDVLVFIETVRGDLFDPVNSRHMKRLRALTHRLQRFQSEREGQKVRYHRS